MIAFNRLSQRISAMVSILFNAASRQSDHQRLTQYIVALNQKKEPESIISEVSLCLKDILNYRLFAFVIKTSKGIDVWLDPRMYKKSLESIVIQDFNIQDKEQINYLNHSFHPGEKEKRYSLNNLISYDLNEECCQAKLYMLPSQSLSAFHDEMVNIILTSTGIALSRQMSIEQLTNAAVLDPLTGCYNRRELENQINRTIANAKRQKNQLSIFMFDIDHFKHVNDTYGHQTGDLVLKEIAALVKDNIRTGDMLTRYGGEEFIAVLPDTNKQEAIELADRIRRKIGQKKIKTLKDSLSVTASFGVAALSPDTDMSALIHDADTMMYKAKLSGRNTVMPGLIKICSASQDTGS